MRILLFQKVDKSTKLKMPIMTFDNEKCTTKPTAKLHRLHSRWKLNFLMLNTPEVQGFFETAKQMINEPTECEQTVIDAVTRRNDKQKFEFLLENGANIAFPKCKT